MDSTKSGEESELDRVRPAAPPVDRDLAISTYRLRKVFNGKVAVRSLTLDVHRGEVFGFLGPNGAGKSTSVKMLLALVKPTSGTASVLGYPVGKREVRARIGFLPEHFRFYDWLTPAELLELHGQLNGLPRNTLQQRVPALLDAVGLTPHRDKQLRRFSKGMLQRIGLAQALVNEPDLLFLDEPTSGLDPLGRKLVRDLIRAQRDRGTTVFLNSHLLGEVEATCDRVAFIRNGEIVETHHLSTFAQQSARIRLRAHGISDTILAGLRARVSHLHTTQDHLVLTIACEALAPCILHYLVECGVDVFEFTPERESLEDRFLKLMGKDEGL